MRPERTRVACVIVIAFALWGAVLIAGAFWLRPRPIIIIHAPASGKDNCELYQLRVGESDHRWGSLRPHHPSSDTAAYVWWRGLSEPVNSFTSLLLIAPAIYAAHEGMSHAYSALFCVLSAASFGNHLTHVLGFHLLDYLCLTTLHCVVCMDFYRNHSPWRGWRIGVTLALAVYVWMVMSFERVVRDTAYEIDVYPHGRMHGPYVALCVCMMHVATRTHGLRMVNLVSDICVAVVIFWVLPRAGYGFADWPSLNMPVVLVHTVMMQNAPCQSSSNDDRSFWTHTWRAYAALVFFLLAIYFQERWFCEHYQYVHAVYHALSATGYTFLMGHMRHARSLLDARYTRLQVEAVSVELC
ncbi:hypothetical protein CYMTET_4209 [Cymbomonas tetramitiformis]|uniref:Uncharacterized protein n=1 Tax=Cymbomonas tetramitiformis TaxID=36881 RepID=A0AAE0LKQ9_9CHLO|nr:hypothetical protein CYMTET_4209 [Cymbomonas tetramitiformis]